MLKHFITFLIILTAGLFVQSNAQTILAPDLQCAETDNTNGNITLSWTNPPANPCGAFVQYTIYASSTGAAGPYNQVAVTSQAATSFVLANYIAISSTWYFYMEANYNCPGATVLQSDTINNLNPITPNLVNVDVTQSGTVVINWDPSVSAQTHGYVVYYYLPNGNAVPLDTVYGRFNTTYTDLGVDPSLQSLVYTVAAFDSCGKISAYNTLPHNTILTAASSSPCETIVHIGWNKYINWPQGVQEYQILVSANNGNFINVGAVDSTKLTYDYSGFVDGDSLCIIVRAVSAADTTIVSNSNMVCMKAAIIQPPAYLYITNATVGLDNYIEVSWMVDPNAELIYFKLDRSNNNITFTPAAQIPAPVTLSQFNSKVDSTEDLTPEKNPYYYTVTAIDSCQKLYVTPYVKTISLQGELYDYYVSHLTWNNFELENANVLRYNLYRDYGTGFQLIKSFLPGTNEYSDSLFDYITDKGLFCYRVEAVYDINLPNGIYHDTLSSFSNQQCIIHRPIIYIPNAFAPNGLNNVFKPTIVYGNPQGYLMQIYNRYGGLVFETQDPNTGWDGNDRGKPAMQGGYAYLITFKAEDGVSVERKGMVLLVK